MAENINEENLDNPTNAQSENPPGDIIPTIDTETVKPNQESENMEVHHHAHDPAAPHYKKNWKSYFWEFLMLFLAITLGFLVENQREHYIEHLRAKEFAKSLVEDLENDTSAITLQMKRTNIYISNTDSLLHLSKTLLENRNAAKFSFYTRFMYWTAPLLWNRATFEQVKNSGSLRYFRNFQLLKKLMKYEAGVNGIEAETFNQTIRGNTLLSLINEFIDPQIHYNLSNYQLLSLDTMSIKTKERYFNIETASLEKKRTVIKEFLNMSIVQQRNLVLNNIRLQMAKKLGVELINELKKEYHLE